MLLDWAASLLHRLEEASALEVALEVLHRPSTEAAVVVVEEVEA